MKYLLKCNGYYVISIELENERYQRTKNKKEAHRYESKEAAESAKNLMSPFMFFTKWAILETAK